MPVSTIATASFHTILTTHAMKRYLTHVVNMKTAFLLNGIQAIQHTLRNSSIWIGAVVVGLVALVGATQTQAAIVIANSPVDGLNTVTLNVSAQNDDTGAIYNSAQLNVFKDLASQLYALPANQATYGSISDLMTDWNFTIRSSAPGNVYNGWNFEKQNDGGINLSNESLTGGEPGTDYDIWNSNPGSDTQAYTLIIPKSQLEFDGIVGYNPTTDASIVLSGETMANAFTGYEGGAANISHSADGFNYQVAVPEPKTYALLFGLTGLVLVAVRRRNYYSETKQTTP